MNKYPVTEVVPLKDQDKIRFTIDSNHPRFKELGLNLDANQELLTLPVKEGLELIYNLRQKDLVSPRIDHNNMLDKVDSLRRARYLAINQGPAISA